MRNSGFTLIEFLVTSVIIAFVMLVAVSSQRTLSGIGLKIDDYGQTCQELRYASKWLRRDLANVYRSRKKEDIVFAVDSQAENEQPGMTLRFYALNNTNIRPDKPEAEIYEIEYFLQSNAGQSNLMRRIQANPAIDGPRGGIISVVAENIELFQVKCLDSQSQNFLPDWPIENQQMPELLEITIAGKTAKTNKKISEKLLIDFPFIPQIDNDKNNNKK